MFFFVFFKGWGFERVGLQGLGFRVGGSSVWGLGVRI